MRFGMKLISSAAVESQMRGSAGMNPGATGSEPAAMIAFLKRTDRAPSAVSTCRVFGEVNLPPAGHDPHFALLGKTGQAARQSLDHPILPAANGRGVERGLTELDPMRAHRGRLVDDLGDVQQRLRWDAADVEADAAERLPGVDQHDIPPEIGGAEGGGVAARAGAEDENVRLDIRLSAGIGARASERSRARPWA